MRINLKQLSCNYSSVTERSLSLKIRWVTGILKKYHKGMKTASIY